MRTLWRLASDQNCTRQFCAVSRHRLEVARGFGVAPLAAHALLLLVLIPGLAKALGLGNLDIQTHLEQPLLAHIELIAVNPDDLDQIKVRLADQKEFEWVGIERTSALEQLRFSPFVNKSGVPTIAITTAHPPEQDSLNFLIEVRWPEGRLLREYNIRLEPLSAADRPSPVVINTPTERSVTPQRVPSSPRPTTLGPERASGDTSAASPQPSDAPIVPPLTNPYTTMRGDTLYEIAGLYLPDGDVNTRQMALALFRANPDAFNNLDINNLKANVPLRIPDLAEIEQLSRRPLVIETKAQMPEVAENEIQSATKQMSVRGEPKPEVRLETPAKPDIGGDAPPREATPVETQVTEKQQAAQSSENEDEQAPQAAETDGHLEIITAEANVVEPEAETVSADGYIANLENTVALTHELAESRKQENNELKTRLQELENMITRQQRLITLQTTQLAEIQKAMLANAQQATPIIWQWVLITLIGMTIMLMVLVLRLYRRD